MRYAGSGIQLNTDLRIDFDLSFDTTIVRNWFPPTKSAFSAPYNMLAYHDIFFAGVCEQVKKCSPLSRSSLDARPFSGRRDKLSLPEVGWSPILPITR